jgi:hypothetical protein
LVELKLIFLFRTVNILERKILTQSLEQN